MPLALRLKKEAHREIAKAQDLIVEAMYSIFNNAVLHGGTAIWRCYNGNRFSEDVDVYIKKDIAKLEGLFEALAKAGFAIEKKKISENSVYSNLMLNRREVRFEAVFKKAQGSLADFEKADGNFIAVYALTPEELIKEKTRAYLRRLKVRDLYDIFFLIKHVKDKTAVIAELKTLLKGFKEPVDAEELKVLILEGIVPEAGKMIDYIRRYSG